MNNITTTNTIIAFGPPTGSNYERQTRYIGQFCLISGNYKLRMKDRNNDGLCCQYGQVRTECVIGYMSIVLVHVVYISFVVYSIYFQGSYSVTLNGENIIKSDDSNFIVKDYPFKTAKEQEKTIYIVRHAEKGTDCSSGTCIEGLSSKGNERANQLANWTMKNGIVDEVTHVFATHKRRTYLTVLPVAEMANVNVQRFPSGSDDDDDVEKLEEEASICPTVRVIKSTSMGSTIVMSTHRSAIYGILTNGYDDEEEEDRCTGLGLDTSNSANFPKDDEGKLDSGYSDLWKITIDANGKPRLEERLILDFDLD